LRSARLWKIARSQAPGLEHGLAFAEGPIRCADFIVLRRVRRQSAGCVRRSKGTAMRAVARRMRLYCPLARPLEGYRRSVTHREFSLAADGRIRCPRLAGCHNECRIFARRGTVPALRRRIPGAASRSGRSGETPEDDAFVGSAVRTDFLELCHRETDR